MLYTCAQVYGIGKIEVVLVLLLCSSGCSMFLCRSFNTPFSASKERIRLRFDACTFHTPGIVNAAPNVRNSSGRDRSILRIAKLYSKTRFFGCLGPCRVRYGELSKFVAGLTRSNVCAGGVKCRGPVYFLSGERCDEENNTVAKLNPGQLA